MAKQDEILISIADLWRVCKSKKRVILFCAVLGACITFLYTMTRPTTYVATGTFRDKTSGQVGFSGQMGALMGAVLGGSEGGTSTSIMKSQKVMHKLIKELGFQVSLSEKVSQSSWSTIFNNIRVLRAARKGMCEGPVLANCDLGIICRDITYDSPYVSSIGLNFISDDRFEVLVNKKSIGKEYRFGERVETPQFSFCLDKTSQVSMNDRRFHIKLLPLEEIANSLRDKISIVKDKADKNLLIISYANPDPNIAAAVVNGMMKSYKDYLEEENKTAIIDQLSYLESRQDEMMSKLEKQMIKHADYLKDHAVSHGGFLELSKEMDFVGERQSDLKQRIFDIDLELHLLDSDEPEAYLYNDNIQDGMELHSKLFLKRREFQHSRDLITLSLLQDGSEISTDKFFEGQVKALQVVQNEINSTDELLHKLQAPVELSEKITSIHESKTVPQIWKEHLLVMNDEMKEMNLYVKSVEAFLNNQRKLLAMQVDVLQNRIVRRQVPDINLQGLSNDTAESLYESYNEQRDEIQEKIRHYQSAKGQLLSSDMGLSALASIFKESDDIVCFDLLEEASLIEKRLFDEHNLSPKEVSRLKEELNVKKTFLLDHLSQAIETQGREESLLKEKLINLGRTMIDICNQEIAVINDQLNVYKLSRRNALLHQKVQVAKELHDLNLQISNLPDQWLLEKHLHMQSEMSEKVVQELAKLVEGKNIASNLTKSESAPLEMAVAPVLPTPPPVFIYGLGGAFIGGLLACIAIVMSALFKGVIVSEDNLFLMGQNIAGRLSNSDNDLQIARRLVNFLGTTIKERGQVISLITGFGRGCMSLLASLLVKKGDSVVVLDLTLLQKAEEVSKEEASLKSYLENGAAPFIRHLSSGYDYVYGGSYTPFGVELLQRKSFGDYLETLKSQYDWVFLVMPVSALSGEAESLKELGDKIIVTLHEEKLHEIRPYLREVSRTSFLFT